MHIDLSHLCFAFAYHGMYISVATHTILEHFPGQSQASYRETDEIHGAEKRFAQCEYKQHHNIEAYEARSIDDISCMGTNTFGNEKKGKIVLCLS